MPKLEVAVSVQITEDSKIKVPLTFFITNEIQSVRRDR
jgi:hypothetical protein